MILKKKNRGSAVGVLLLDKKVQVFLGASQLYCETPLVYLENSPVKLHPAVLSSCIKASVCQCSFTARPAPHVNRSVMNELLAHTSQVSTETIHKLTS